jgi:hypothetical protein
MLSGASGRRLGYRPAMLRSRSGLALLLTLVALTSACRDEPWTDTERAEASRMCRGQFGFPPISIFESQDAAYVRHMCQCEVDWLSTRIPHRKFEDRLKLIEVNRVLQAGGAYCLQQIEGKGR